MTTRSDDEGGDEVDLARLTRELDQARRRGAKQGVPALRKLELLAEQKRTPELTSDFDDYDLDEPRPGPPCYTLTFRHTTTKAIATSGHRSQQPAQRRSPARGRLWFEHVSRLRPRRCRAAAPAGYPA